MAPARWLSLLPLFTGAYLPFIGLWLVKGGVYTRYEGLIKKPILFVVTNAFSGCKNALEVRRAQ